MQLVFQQFGIDEDLIKKLFLSHNHKPPSDQMIVFNRATYFGKESEYVNEVLKNGSTQGDGNFTKLCHQLLEKKYGFLKTYLTTSCSDALELAALLCDIKPGDEVICPSFTFVSTANAFLLRGARLVFCDSEKENPNMDVNHIEQLITNKTKAIAVMHYAGIGCNMEAIMALAEKHNLLVVEDAAQCIDAYYHGKPLGSIGHLGAFSFHATKNITCGEGGFISVNDERFRMRAEIIREKGTNRASFFRGEVDKYGWVEMGSSFLPSDIVAAVLYGQLEQLSAIQQNRMNVWNQYHDAFNMFEKDAAISRMYVPENVQHNAHMYYLLFQNLEQRSSYIDYMKSHEVQCSFHYLSLHDSKFFRNQYSGGALKNSDHFSNTLVRLPLYNGLSKAEIDQVIDYTLKFYKTI